MKYREQRKQQKVFPFCAFLQFILITSLSVEELCSMGFSCLFIIGRSLKKILGNYLLCQWIQNAIWEVKKKNEEKSDWKNKWLKPRNELYLWKPNTLEIPGASGRLQQLAHHTGDALTPLLPPRAFSDSATTSPCPAARPGLAAALSLGTLAPHGCSLPFPPAAVCFLAALHSGLSFLPPLFRGAF